MYSLRRAKQSDVDALTDLYSISWQKTFADVLSYYFQLEDRKKLWAEFLKLRSSQGAYVAYHADQIIGVTTWREMPYYIDMLALYVNAKFQSRGIGTALFHQIADHAKKKDKPLVTQALQGHLASLFYEKMGMKPFKTVPAEVAGVSTLITHYSNEF